MKVSRFFIICTVSALICSCSKPSESGKQLLAVSLPQLVDVVEYVAGDEFEVVTVVEGNVDTETFEPSPMTMTKVSKADALFISGKLPFERSLSNSIGTNTKVVDLSEGLSAILGTHGDELEEDPHIWASLKNLKTITGTVCEALISSNPDSSQCYQRRAAELIARIDSLDAYADSVLAAAGRPAFGIWHPSLSYLARDYGLEQISIGSEHRELTPRQIRDAVENLKTHGVKVLYYQTAPEQTAAATVATAAGIEAQQLPVYSKPYSSVLIEIVNSLANNQ